MKISEIRAMPTTVRRDELSPGTVGAHESVLRSYHIVAKVRWMLEQGTPANVVLSLMDEMEDHTEPTR